MSDKNHFFLILIYCGNIYWPLNELLYYTRVQQCYKLCPLAHQPHVSSDETSAVASELN